MKSITAHYQRLTLPPKQQLFECEIFEKVQRLKTYECKSYHCNYVHTLLNNSTLVSSHFLPEELSTHVEIIHQQVKGCGDGWHSIWLESYFWPLTNFSDSSVATTKISQASQNTPSSDNTLTICPPTKTCSCSQIVFNLFRVIGSNKEIMKKYIIETDRYTDLRFFGQFKIRSILFLPFLWILSRFHCKF